MSDKKPEGAKPEGDAAKAPTGKVERAKGGGFQGWLPLVVSFVLMPTLALATTRDQLLDLSNTTMASKTISDLKKPGSRNQIRAELISIFNNALGGNLVQEIYFTEFAVQ